VKRKLVAGLFIMGYFFCTTAVLTYLIPDNILIRLAAIAIVAVWSGATVLAPMYEEFFE